MFLSIITEKTKPKTRFLLISWKLSIIGRFNYYFLDSPDKGGSYFPDLALSSSTIDASSFWNNGDGGLKALPDSNSVGCHRSSSPADSDSPASYNITVCVLKLSSTSRVTSWPKIGRSYPRYPCSFSLVCGRKGAKMIFSQSMACMAV